MYDIIKIALWGLFFGTFGTTIGGVIGVYLKIKSNKALGVILEFAAGLMTSIVCFDLIPEAMANSNLVTIIIGLLLGIIGMMICDGFVRQRLNYKEKNKTSSLLKAGLVIGIGLALHNFPEGLAIGSGFDASYKLGISVAIAIAIHDIPEGISMAVPMKNGGMTARKVALLTFLSGITTGIGALFGAMIGNISESLISACLAFAAGAMLYIISGELVPESNKLYNGRMASIGNIIGIILGIIACNL